MYPEARPVILRTPEETDALLDGEMTSAHGRQWPLPSDTLQVVARGEDGRRHGMEQAGSHQSPDAPPEAVRKPTADLGKAEGVGLSCADGRIGHSRGSSASNV